MKAKYPRWFTSRNAYEALDSDDDSVSSGYRRRRSRRELSTTQNKTSKYVDESPRCAADVSRSARSFCEISHTDELDLFEKCSCRTQVEDLEEHSLLLNQRIHDDATKHDRRCIGERDEVDGDDGDASIASQDMTYRTQYHDVHDKHKATQSPPPFHELGKSYPLPCCKISFETQETRSETSSSSFASSIEDDRIDPLKHRRSVRWLDETLNQPLSTIHSIGSFEPETCRVVILLHMNNGQHASPDTNFEFLHCEFSCHERHRVSDVLEQIECLTKSKKSFNALYFNGRELINAFALQDYQLEDGYSVLVALREGQERRSVLLAQAAILLSDRMLRLEIRKARVAGRSLQTLHSTLSWRERKGYGTSSLSTGQDMDGQFMFFGTQNVTREA